jgi:Arc/MetJ family transcription regulator
MMAARRTTMNIDHELVARAQEILGTETATATVHKALDEVIRRFYLERLMARDFSGMTEDDVREMRRPRTRTREWGPELDSSERDRDAS